MQECGFWVEETGCVIRLRRVARQQILHHCSHISHTKIKELTKKGLLKRRSAVPENLTYSQKGKYHKYLMEVQPYLYLLKEADEGQRHS